MNEEQAKVVIQMTNTISKRGIQYLSDFIKFCLRYNQNWYEMVVNHRAVQYEVIMALENSRIN